MFDCISRSFRATVHSQFGEDAADIIAYRAFTQE
jgi:hypothetical protein